MLPLNDFQSPPDRTGPIAARLLILLVLFKPEEELSTAAPIHQPAIDVKQTSDCGKLLNKHCWISYFQNISIYMTTSTTFALFSPKYLPNSEYRSKTTEVQVNPVLVHYVQPNEGPVMLPGGHTGSNIEYPF